MSINVLWISPFVPYDSVPHAGGQIENYYIKSVHRHSDIALQLLTFADADELARVDLDDYGLPSIVHTRPPYDKWGYRLRKLNLFSDKAMLSYFDEYHIRRDLSNFATTGRVFDVVVLQWTQSVLAVPIVKRYFPSAKIVCIEEDVSFLSFERRYKMEHNALKRALFYNLYKRLKRSELSALAQADMIVVNNHKDYNLLVEAGISIPHIHEWCPYYHSFISAPHIGDTTDLLFYGAMSRAENYLSVIWFIDNVLDKIAPRFRLVVVGNKPPQELLARANERVVITGFVDDPTPYFVHSCALVAPLVLGAGVKIKIIEALSAGMPILTNSIGIEGIPARDGVEYLHCETAEEYIEAINTKLADDTLLKNMSASTKALAVANYDYEHSADIFAKKLLALAQK